MKALIRNEGETVTEKDGIIGIDWNTGAPLTNPAWCGGPYRLVQDYVEIADTEVEFTMQERGTGVNHANTPIEEKSAETVTIDGKEYTKDELLALLNQTS